MENKIIETNEYILMKTPKGYLRDVWECWEDKQNYDFTDDPRYAYKFVNGMYRGISVPKYLYNWKDDCSIETMEEALKFLNGELVMVSVTREITWEVKKFK